MDIPNDPRPAWCKPGHTWAKEPAWWLLPRDHRPQCETCPNTADQEHTPNETRLYPRQTVTEPRRYWGD